MNERRSANVLALALACAVWLAAPARALAFGSGSKAPDGACYLMASKVLGKNVRYCLDEARTTSGAIPKKNREAIFFFHGFNQPIDDWFKFHSAEFHKRVDKLKGARSTTAIAFETSNLSFHTDRRGVSQGPDAYETFLTKEFIPYITQKLDLCDARECRAAVGYSMGGYGALKTALRHPKLFSEVAISAPALAPFSPFDSDWKWTAYFARNPVGPLLGHNLLKRLRDVFGDDEYFAENDPIELLRDYPASKLPALYLDSFERDFYGLHEGFARLKDVLDARGIPHRSRVYPGTGHMNGANWPVMIDFVFGPLVSP